jgi:hypothetical protein
MRASETRNAAGNEAITLPDLGAYGRGNKGIFGVCQHPVYPDMPVSRGRTFYWGEPCPGLLRFYTTAVAARSRYVLEPTLSPLADLWAAITGDCELPDDDRHDLTETAAGRVVPGTAGVRAKLAAVASILHGTRPADDDPYDGEGDRAAPGQAPASQDDQMALARLRAELTERGPRGLSSREATEVVPFQKSKCQELLARLCAEGFAVVRGAGRGARYYRAADAPPGGTYPPLRAVPDLPGDASEGVS